MQAIFARHIGLRFAFHVLLFSIFVALVAATFGVWDGYRKAVAELDRQFIDVERSFTASLALSVWNIDRNNTHTQLLGLMNLPGISGAWVLDARGEDVMRLGQVDGDGLVVRRFALLHDAWGQQHKVGELRVAASIHEIRRGLLSEAFSGLVGETLRIFLIAAFVLLLYQNLIGRHLQKISTALKAHEADGLPREFFLRRGANFDHDELGEIEVAFRSMRGRINAFQSQLRQSEQRANSIIDNLGDGLLQVHEGGRIDRVNQAAERMFGLSAFELVGQHVSALFPSAIDDRPGHGASGGEDPRLAGVEVQCRRSGGTLFPADLVVAHLPLDRGVSEIWLVRDLSERRASEEQRDFVDMVSHEFRTPLAIINTSLQLLIANIHQPSARVLQRSENIRNATQRLIHLLDDYLSSDRMDSAHQAFKLQACDLFEVIESATNDWPLDRIRVGLHSLPSSYVCDPELMRIALRNLLANADRHSPAGATIDVEARGLANGGVTIRIQDLGDGIPANEVPRLFQRYFRGRAAQGQPGAGLGLYLVEKIVHGHGGTIEVQSALRHGSVFTIHLPGRGLSAQ